MRSPFRIKRIAKTFVGAIFPFDFRLRKNETGFCRSCARVSLFDPFRRIFYIFCIVYIKPEILSKIARLTIKFCICKKNIFNNNHILWLIRVSDFNSFQKSKDYKTGHMSAIF